MINFQNIKLLPGLLLFYLFTSIPALAQSPYSLSNEWRFGAGAGLSFPTGDFPDASITPTATPVGSNTGSENVEASTSISDKSGNTALYSNTVQVRNIANSIIRNLATDNTCAGSATGGGVAIPDPASPNDTYYLFLANDITGGACASKGINYYKFQKDGSGEVIYLSGPVNIASGSFADESITAGNDGHGNYWIVGHSYSNNTFKVWKVDVTGVTAITDQSKPQSTPDVNSNQAYSKISPCQDKIAWFGGGKLLVYEFDRHSGIIGSALLERSGLGHSVGIEFSPNGQFIYYSGQGSVVTWINIVTGTDGTIAGSGSWTMQIGPDAKIYTSPGGNNIGVIENPDDPTATSYTNISLGGGSTFRGISNLAWLSPEPPQINNTTNVCTIDLDYEFKNYFSTDIDVDASTIQWDFGDGDGSTLPNPSHTYDTDGTYTVKLTFNDATCGHTFTDSIEVTVSSCDNVVTPPGCTYNLEAKIDPVSNVDLDEVTPVTLNLNGSNSIFDISATHSEKYYWILSSADTTQAFSNSANTSLTFAYNGSGGHLSQGTYEVFLVTREGACVDTTSISFNVQLSSSFCIFNLEAVIDPVSNVILDETNPVTVDFNGSNSTFDNSITYTEEYYWILGSPDITQAFSTSSSPSLTFDNNGSGANYPPGSYDLYLVTREGPCTDTTVINFDVFSPFVGCVYNLEAKINPVNDIEINEKTVATVYFSADSSIFDPSGAYDEKYYWMIGTPDTMLAFSNDANTYLTFAVNGLGGHLPQDNYDIYLVTREGLCLDTTKVNFNVTYFFIPNLVTPNGDRFNERFEITNTAGRFDVQIFNRWGDKVYDEKGYTNNWELSKVSDGIYFYHIRDGKSEKYYTGWLQVLR